MKEYILPYQILRFDLKINLLFRQMKHLAKVQLSTCLIASQLFVTLRDAPYPRNNMNFVGSSTTEPTKSSALPLNE